MFGLITNYISSQEDVVQSPCREDNATSPPEIDPNICTKHCSRHSCDTNKYQRYMNTQNHRTYVLILNCLNGHTPMNELWDANTDLRTGMASRFTLEFYFHLRMLMSSTGWTAPLIISEGKRKRIFDNLYKTLQAPGTRVSLQCGQCQSLR